MFALWFVLPMAATAKSVFYFVCSLGLKVFPGSFAYVLPAAKSRRSDNCVEEWQL